MNCIYKITCDLDPKYMYIGYTKDLSKRVEIHLSKAKNNQDRLLYRTMREKGIANWSFNTIVSLPSYDRPTLKKLEKYYYNFYKKNYTLLNAQEPMRTIEQYQKDHYGDIQNYRAKNREKYNKMNRERNAQNKEIIRARAKMYYLKNKNKILNTKKERWQCLCGDIISLQQRSSHIKSIKHKKNLKNNFLCEIIKK